ncbi:peptidase U32 family protein [Shewanella algae]|uniref:peptidase U32 family protein n=1 Tax=Shewanella algae TaxID=38313 RepID=UPI00131F5585|nr:U32 family peptidase [Shewanella algae]MBC8798224.1 U32 family peptidase [Shewanella algae]MBO2581001.1 U32 family peptidase [Shewanella algae]MBO2614907.1 U32 family peptidase [Shewanella algae]MDO8255591.1 U32 family peptidase [Shewanella algae]QHD52519.1 collagenase-like protease [Shewanella algae]
MSTTGVELFNPGQQAQAPDAAPSQAVQLADNKLELMAPAKNADFGIEAIRHGADAVYIGGPAFGARHTAGNSVEDIARLCEFAHRYHAQVFVTFNTILLDDELEEAKRLIWAVYEAGADAIIVQDLGLLELDLPPIALHASTQMDNRVPAKVAFLEHVGFSQVVLARELSLSQIRAVAAETKMRLEFFIHGALCVAYSGQCYISEAYTDRSANRGECSQQCRMPGNLKTRQGDIIASNDHMLSLKDNNQTDNLEALIDAGIRSFKIEGRLKDLSYVKNVTAHYRQQLDAIMARRPEFEPSSHGRCRYSFTPDPDKSFNRGKTDYFVNERKADIGDFRTPKYLGVEVGKVSKIGKDFIQVDSDAEFHNGDGLGFFAANYQKARLSDDKLTGFRVNRAEGNTLYLKNMPKDLYVGATLYRNKDQAFEALLAKESAERTLLLDFSLSNTQTGLALTAADRHGHQATVTADFEKQQAKDITRNRESLGKHLAKLGNTDFRLGQVDLGDAEAVFVPASIINGLRRDAIAALDEVRIQGYQRPTPWVRDDSARFPQRSLTYLGNVANQKAKDFYTRHGVVSIRDAYEVRPVKGDAPLMITKHCIRYSYNMCPKEVPGIKAEPLEMELGGKQFKLVFDCHKCEMLLVG